MESVEFEVRESVPPRNVGAKSMWNNETEIPRVIELRRSAMEAFQGRRVLSENIKLGIEIHIPKSYNKPGDLDNFIKGICDSLYVPKVSLENPNFPIHEYFDLPENQDVNPRTFEIIKDDEQIVEIHAKKIVGDEEELFYSVKIEGE